MVRQAPLRIPRRRGSRVLFDFPIFRWVARDYGGPHEFYALESRDWCNILPVTADGRVVLVRQFRCGVEALSLETPGGIVDRGEDPRAAALRELAEETGYAPLPGASVWELGFVHPNPALQDNRCHLYAVGPVARAGAPRPDPGEDLETVEVALEDLPGMIARGELSHALALATVTLLPFRAPGSRGDGSASSIELLRVLRGA